MRLSEIEYDQYLRIHPPLLYHFGVREKLIKKGVDLEGFLGLPMEEKIPVRDKLYDKIAYIDQFVKENPAQLSTEDLEIAKGFKDFRRGQFWVVKYQKKYTIFLDKTYAFGVLALSDPFQLFLGDHLPMIVEAVLLPFKGKIVYDGMLRFRNVYFGSGMTSSIRHEYQQAKVQYGIITSLPIDKATKSAKLTDEDRLTLYMKNARSREEYWGEIQELAGKSPALESLYNLLWGRINTRGMKKELKSLGVKGYHFAVFNRMIIASGKSRAEVEKQVKAMLRK